MIDKQDQKFGAVALIGATNAGKSTLTNAMVGEKVAITSHKVQTTRFQIRGILTHENAQIVLIDTPGFFKPRRKFDRSMITAAWDALEDVDIAAFLIDVSKPYDDQKQSHYLDKIIQMTEEENRILILNKVDETPKKRLLEIAAKVNEKCAFDQTFMVSALKGAGVSDIIDYCVKKMPDGEWPYDADDLTTVPSRLLAAEITREKVYARLHQELPYKIAVETEDFKPADNGKGLAISQIIIIEDKKHKSIVLGKQGQTLKSIGSQSRVELMDIFQCPVHLQLYVQHRENWMDKDEAFTVFES
jgi:GTP-binding protein Era